MTAATAERAVRTPPRARTRLEKLLAALPLASVYLWACLIYAYQASAHRTPWLFSDEIEFTNLSRAVASTGHAALRGTPHTYESLYVYLLAPVWWINSTGTAYAVGKTLGVVVMAAAVFPTYALARMLVRPVPALVAATLAVTAPALGYSAFLVTEPLAYPWATLTFYAVVRAIARSERRWAVTAVLLVYLASRVRSELQVLVPVALLAVAWFVWTSAAVSRLRARWNALHWVVFAVGLAALVYGGHRLAAARSPLWHIGFVELPDRSLRYGDWAAGALAIGLGVLPVVLGLTTLARPREDQTPALRAFVGVFGASIVAFWLYTATKATYLSTVFAIRVEERNMIYLSPLVAVAFAVWLDRPRVRLWALAASGALVGWLIYSTPYQLSIRPYSDAPGLSVLAWMNRRYHWDDPAVRRALFVVLALAVVLGAVFALTRATGRWVAPVLAVVSVGAVAWTLTGEVEFANGSNDTAELFATNLPQPLDWIDRATGRRDVTYIGQSLQGGNGTWSLEFWNRGIKNVGSVDGSAPGPGPALRPSAYKADGTVLEGPKTPYVLEDQGVDLLGREVARRGGLRLLRVDGPLRYRSTVSGVSLDGWTGAQATYSRFAAPAAQDGILTVSVSRRGWNGPNVPSDVEVKVGRLVPPTAAHIRNPCLTDPCASLDPHMGRVLATRHWTAQSGQTKVFRIPVRTPVQVELTVDPTFRPSDFGAPDNRDLGVQPSFSFRPNR